MYSVEKAKGLNFLKNFDYVLYLSILILTCIGLLALSSATMTMKTGDSIMKKQIIGLFIGLILSLIIGFIDYKMFKSVAFVLYAGSLLLLVLVLFIGTGEETLGTKGWFRIAGFTFQPAELAKITYILFVSVFLERLKDDQQLHNSTKNITRFFLYSAIPCVLILLQPDYGMTIVFIFIFIVMAFVGEIPLKYLYFSAASFVPFAVIAWFFLLNERRKSRIISFIFPKDDMLGARYQVDRSITAIGSGQINGSGLYNGYQTQNRGVPVSESDFIFAVIGEELGFVGAIVVVMVIFFVLLKSISIAKNSRELYGSYVTIGITAMFSFNFVENIGMCVGLLPVTGIPLPFVSSGGSAMITNYIAVGLLISVSMRRKRALFDTGQ